MPLKRVLTHRAISNSRIMPDYPDQAPPGEDYRQLAHRLRALAQETRRPYARQELLKLSGIYDRRAEHLDRGAD
jgi:hypothetical protein